MKHVPMLNKKPSFEKISPSFGSSILVKQHNKEIQNTNAFWHFHPEVELVYVNKAQGKRHIGNHLSYFNNSMLILIGANLPHNGFVDRLTTTGKETIVQFKLDFLGNTFYNIPEMTNINALFERAKKGMTKITIFYQKSLKWQELNFSALEIFITKDNRLEIKGL